VYPEAEAKWQSPRGACEMRKRSRAKVPHSFTVRERVWRFARLPVYATQPPTIALVQKRFLL
jgi:hypothetical protein